MAEAARFVKAVEEHQRVLLSVVRTWQEAVGGLHLTARRPEKLLAALVLPIEAAVAKPLDLRELAGAMPAAWQRVPDKPLRQVVRTRLQLLSAEVLGANFELLRTLSGLAYESASYRSLITEDDGFDVSGASVLGAAALANLTFVLRQLNPNRPRRLKSEVLETVDLALQMAGHEEFVLRPGDLWILDLIARTVRQAHARLAGPAATASGVPAGDLCRDPDAPGSTRPLTAGSLLEAYVARFISVSTVHKLLEARDFPPALAKRCRYDHWPGLEVVVSDPHAESLRSLIVGELARSVASDTVGLAQGAFFRFLQTLMKVEDPAAKLNAILIIARLLWELLEQDATVLRRLMEREKVSRVLAQAIGAVEATAWQGPPGDGVHRKLVETCRCLQTYDQYRALLSLLASMGGSAKRPVHATEGTN